MKNKKLMALGLVGVATVALVGCQEENEKETVVAEDKTADTKTTEKVEDTKVTADAGEFDADVVKALEEALYENAENMEEENLESYLDDLVLDDATKEAVGEQIQQIFELTDLVYEIKDIKVLDVDGNNATVQVTQVTKAVESEIEFNDNEGVLVHKMQFEDGKWKFVSTEAKTVTYLDAEAE